jgi:hypothetical protein
MLNTLKKIIPIACFAYGCTGIVLCVTWFFFALNGKAGLPANVWLIAGPFASIGLVLILTQHPSSWRPVLNVTPIRARFARVAMLIAFTNATLCLLSVFLWRPLHLAISLDVLLESLLSSMVLLWMTYITIIWGFRPENVFSVRLRRFAGNPILYLLSDRYRSN